MSLESLLQLQKNVTYTELVKYKKARIVSSMENLRSRIRCEEDVYSQEFNKGYLLGLEEDLLELMIAEEKEKLTERDDSNG